MLDNDLFKLALIRAVAFGVEAASMESSATFGPSTSYYQYHFSWVTELSSLDIALDQWQAPFFWDVLRLELLIHPVIPHEALVKVVSAALGMLPAV